MGAPINLAGQKFGRLTVLDLAGKTRYGNYLWRVACDCGTELSVASSHLRDGHSKSCGCSRKAKPKPLRLVPALGRSRDLTGQQVGRLLVLWAAGRKGRGLHWACSCSCGQTTIVHGIMLRGGRTRSCGCYQRELARKRATTHGGSGTPEFSSWSSMFQRCTNPQASGYMYYGGRGITICERWNDFANFLADLGPRPDGTSLDRINNNDGYHPANCRWATPLQQQNNRRPYRKRQKVAA